MGNRTYHQRGKLIHGYRVRSHPLYRIWASMLSRCTNPNEKHYPNYGGRGISVCEEWSHFENFANDMHPKPSSVHTIERIDNSKGYSKNNCRWASRSEQCVNRRKFKNNNSGETGVVKIGEIWSARFDFENVRYQIGRFKNKNEAIKARRDFVNLFFVNREKAIESLPKETVSINSTTGTRGISKHKSGGYVARATINGERFYIGYFENLESAKNARTEFIENRVRKS